VNQSDKLNYELFGIKNSKIDDDYQRHLSERLRQITPSDVWLLDQP
jgi:hypothetical protein